MLVLKRKEGQWVEIIHRSGDVIRLAVRFSLQLCASAELIADILADRGSDVSGRTILRPASFTPDQVSGAGYGAQDHRQSRRRPEHQNRGARLHARARRAAGPAARKPAA